MLTVKDTSKILKVTEQYVRRIMKNGKLKAELKEKQWETNMDSINYFIDKENFVVDPEDRVRQTDELPNFTAISFFSGAMGLDVGLQNVGIEPLLAVENNKNARDTIIKNNKNIGLLGDINDCTPEQLYEYANLSKEQNIDLFLGGPPCQAFSTAGKRKGFEDARGSVFIQYLDLIEKVSPKYVVIENVRGLGSTKAALQVNDGIPVAGGVLYYITKRLNNMGYSVSYDLYNTANFGTPQKRERYVILAKLNGEKLPYLTPTHSKNGEFNLPKWRVLKDAISDIQDNDMDYVEIPESRKDWLKKIPEGGNWKSLSIEDQKEAMGKKYYLGGGKTGFLRRLSFDEPSPTLVTSPIMPATDLIHPTKLRALSVEEYARIQGFPDNWKFSGNVYEKYKLIGNAVPIKLGEAIGKTILNDLNGKNTKIYTEFRYSRYNNTSDVTFPIKYEKNREKALSLNEDEGYTNVKLDI